MSKKLNKKISNKTRYILVGIFILVAYGVLVSGITESKTIVMIADVISGLAVIGIAILLFPLFKPISKKLTFGYLSLKLIEGLLMIAAGLFFLSSSLQPIRDWIYNGIHLYVFIISGFIFYYLLLKSKIVPKFVSIWGTSGISALLISTLLKLVEIKSPIIDYFLILIITNEVFLAIWLMIKGIKVSLSKTS